MLAACAILWFIAPAFGLPSRGAHERTIEARGNFPPWPNIPSVNYTRKTPTFQMNDTGAILIPNCSNPTVDCSPVLACLYSPQADEIKRSSAIDRRQLSEDPFDFFRPQRCNRALYSVEFVIQFVSSVRLWLVRRVDVNNVLQPRLVMVYAAPGQLPDRQIVAPGWDAVLGGQHFHTREPHWQVGFILSPDLLHEFVTINVLSSLHRAQFEVADDLRLALRDNPPRALVNFFNDPHVNGLGLDSRLMHLYQNLMMQGGLMRWDQVTAEEALFMYQLVRSEDITEPFEEMRQQLALYLRARYPESRLHIEWLRYCSVILRRAEASARNAVINLAEREGPEQLARYSMATLLEIQRIIARYRDEHRGVSMGRRSYSPDNVLPSSDSWKRDNVMSGILQSIPDFNDGVSPEEQAMSPSWAYPVDYTLSPNSSLTDGTTFVIPLEPENIGYLVNATAIPQSDDETVTLRPDQ